MAQEDNSLRKDLFRTGWTCSISVGILYVAMGVSHFLLLLEQLSGGKGITSAFLNLLLEGPFLQAQRLVDAAVGVGGLLIAPIWFVGLGQ